MEKRLMLLPKDVVWGLLLFALPLFGCGTGTGGGSSLAAGQGHVTPSGLYGTIDLVIEFPGSRLFVRTNVTEPSSSFGGYHYYWLRSNDMYELSANGYSRVNEKLTEVSFDAGKNSDVTVRFHEGSGSITDALSGQSALFPTKDVTNVMAGQITNRLSQGKIRIHGIPRWIEPFALFTIAENSHVLIEVNHTSAAGVSCKAIIDGVLTKGRCEFMRPDGKQGASSVPGITIIRTPVGDLKALTICKEGQVDWVAGHNFFWRAKRTRDFLPVLEKTSLIKGPFVEKLRSAGFDPSIYGLNGQFMTPGELLSSRDIDR